MSQIGRLAAKLAARDAEEQAAKEQEAAQEPVAAKEPSSEEQQQDSKAGDGGAEATKPIHHASAAAELWSVGHDVYLVDLPHHVSSRVLETQQVGAKFIVETRKSLYECPARPPTVSKDSLAAIHAAAAQVGGGEGA